MNQLERGFMVLVVLVAAALAGVVVGPVSGDVDRSIGSPSAPAPTTFESVDVAGVAVVDGTEYSSAQDAIDAASAGSTVVLRGRFDEHVEVTTADITIKSAAGSLAVLDGSGEGNVLTVNASNVTVRRVWVRNSGFDTSENDAGVWVDAPNVSFIDSRVTAATFGIWVDGVNHVTLRNNTIVGRESVTPRSYRGNGIQLWKTSETRVIGNRITDARDGIYYSWSSDVVARGNELWDLRYGVHYMYSDYNTLENNTAFDNDVGFALMLSEELTVANNTAINNTGTSGHGILLKRIDDSTVRGNVLVGNTRGIYALNSVRDSLVGNLFLENRIGLHMTAGTADEHVVENSFVHNGQPVLAVTGSLHAWNGSGTGNYWSGARTADLNDDGVSELRYRPAGLVELLVLEHPAAAVFAQSPAFKAIRRAERTLPVLDTPGVVDYHPLTTAPHDWRQYYERNRDN